MKVKSMLFISLTLGLLTAFGPFLTDFYLPVLPEMEAYFHASPSLISLSLTASMIGLSVGQILIGPLSDRYGRKKPLILSLLLFILSSFCCIFSPDIYVFNTMRFFQGLGGAGGIVLSKSISSDLFTGKKLFSFLGILAIINSITPVVAPVIGGLLADSFSWISIFILLIFLGIFLTVCSSLLQESLLPERRIRGSLFQIYANLFRVFRNPSFTLPTVAYMFSFAALFAYIASSPFVLQGIYGLDPMQFGLCFGFNGLMIGIGSYAATRFKDRVGVLRIGAFILLSGAILISLALLSHQSFVPVMLSYILLLTGFGIIQPAMLSVALDSERSCSGAAGAVYGAAGNFCGGLVGPFVTMGDITLTSSMVMLIVSFFCCVTLLRLCRKVVVSL